MFGCHCRNGFQGWNWTPLCSCRTTSMASSSCPTVGANLVFALTLNRTITMREITNRAKARIAPTPTITFITTTRR